MATTIRSNGSKWAGEQPDPLDALCQRLREHPLDPRFERYGNFISPAGRGARFHGNFLTVSAAFDVETDEPETIRALTALIRANQRRPDYLLARR